MYIPARERGILEILFQHSEGVTIHFIAECVQVSSRTVHRDLKGIESILKEYELFLYKQPGVGLKLIGSEEKKQELETLVYNINIPNYEYTPQERQTIILYRLLEATEPIKLLALSTEIQVAIATVSSDLDKLEEWLHTYKITLIRKKGYGIEITGSETAKRNAITALFNEHMDQSLLLTSIDGENIARRKLDSVSERLLNLVRPKTLVIVDKVVKNIRSHLLNDIADSSYIGLVVHLALSIERIQSGKNIELDTLYLKHVLDTKEYQIATRIIGELKETFNMDIPKEEVIYITMHLRGAKLRHDSDLEIVNDNYALAYKVNKMIQSVETNIHQSFADRHDLFQGLMMHMAPALYRIKQNMKIHNPLMEHIKRDYPELFSIIGTSAQDIFASQLPEEEIAYLVMHFGSALERKEYHDKISALIVCSNGIGSSKMLASRIENEIPKIDIVCNVSLFDLPKLELESFDLIISTIPISNLERECIVVKPFLSNQDINKIMRAIRERGKQKKESKMLEKKQTTLLRTMKERTEQIRFEHRLRPNITKHIQYLNRSILTIMEGYSFTLIKEKSNIEQVLTQACSKLVKQGVIESAKEVSKALLKRHSMGGLGIPGSSFSLFHTRHPSVVKPSFSIYSLQEPIQIAAIDGTQISIKNILLLLAPKNTMQPSLDLLSYISTLLIENEESIALFSSQDDEKIYRFLNVKFDDYMLQKLQG